MVFKQLSIIGMVILTVVASCTQQQPASDQEKPQTIGQLNAADERFHDLIPENAAIEVLAEGFEWTEGPAWRMSENYVLFSDIPENTIHRWDRENGLSIYLRPAGYIWSDPVGREMGTNGLLFNENDELLACDHGNRAVVKISDQNYTKTILAESYQGQRLNSPNDLVLHSNGDIYFTDPPYGLEGTDESPDKELDFNGVYRIDAQNGEVSLLHREMTRPNGIALSPDEQKLYVANSDPDNAFWMMFDLDTGGGIVTASTFFDATGWVKEGRRGLPDGMTVDAKGNIFATGPGGVLVFTPDGDHLGTIETGEATANCVFGGEDGSTLFITADMYFCRIETNTKGLGL